MQRRAGRWRWLEALWLVSIVLLFALLVWLIKGLTPSGSLTGVFAANAETSVANEATEVANPLIASLPPSSYPGPTVMLPPLPEPYVIGPEDPYMAGGSCGAPVLTDMINFWTERTDVIVLGVVKEILPPRWTTPDGTRPANPHTDDETIFEPVLVKVERFLKGEQPTQQLSVLSEGGEIGQDAVFTSCFNATEGDRVVLFFHDSYWHVAYEGLPAWKVSERFWVQDEQVTTLGGLSAPLPQVLADIEAAQQPCEALELVECTLNHGAD